MQIFLVVGHSLFWLGVVATFVFTFPLLSSVAWLPFFAAFLICYVLAAVVGTFLVVLFQKLFPNTRYLTVEKIDEMGSVWGPIECLGPYLMLGVLGLVAAVGTAATKWLVRGM